MQNQVVQLLAVVLFVFSRYGYLCKGNLEKRSKLPISMYSFAKKEIFPLQRKNSSIAKEATINSSHPLKSYNLVNL